MYGRLRFASALPQYQKSKPLLFWKTRDASWITEYLKKVCPRLRELTPTVRGSHNVRSRDLLEQSFLRCSAHTSPQIRKEGRWTVGRENRKECFVWKFVSLVSAAKLRSSAATMPVNDRIMCLPNNFCNYSAVYSAEGVSVIWVPFCCSAETVYFCRKYFYLPK